MPAELYFGPTVAGVGWIVAVGVAAGLVLAGVSLLRGVGHRSIANRLLVVWLATALVAVAFLTLQPGPQGFDGPRAASFNPFSRLNRRDALANTLLYVPVGLLAVLLWRRRERGVLWATALAFGVSFSIEFAQWVLPIDRAASIHDVIFNTLGGFAGAILGSLVVRATRKLGAVVAPNLE